MSRDDDHIAWGKKKRLMLYIAVILFLGYLWTKTGLLRRCVGAASETTDEILSKLLKSGIFFGRELFVRILITVILMLCSLFEGQSVRLKVKRKALAVLPLSLVVFLFYREGLLLREGTILSQTVFALLLSASFLGVLYGGALLRAFLGERFGDFPKEPNESFIQEERLLRNEYSVNFPTLYTFQGKKRHGWINLVNIFRGTLVLGTPGSGKSYAVIEEYLRQCIEKGFSTYVYDFKYPDLSLVAYNHFLSYRKSYPEKTRFCVVSFDDLRHSMRCNPLEAKFLRDIADAYESAYTIMLNLNRSWIRKQGEFFVESPIVLLTAIIWFLRIYQNGRYCTFPHAIELLNSPYKHLFEILTSYPELESYMSAFIDAWKGGAQDQLQGQIASAKIPLSRIISPTLYWVMSASDFSLDLNSNTEPKILCMGNNPDRQNINSAATGLINSRIVRIMNKKNQRKSCIIIDELPTIYFRGLDNLIATARSNRVAVCLGIQDISQLKRDYGEREATVICNTVGNVFSGQVVGSSASALSERFGKNLQQRRSQSQSESGLSSTVSEQLEQMIPPSRIAALSPGEFVGEVADSFEQEIRHKVFHARILVDQKKRESEMKDFRELPVTYSFLDERGEDVMQKRIDENFRRIKREVRSIVESELLRIKRQGGDIDLELNVPEGDGIGKNFHTAKDNEGPLPRNDIEVEY